MIFMLILLMILTLLIFIKDELDSANNLELNCNNFTINEESTILDDYDMYIEAKKQEKEKKRKQWLTKIINYLKRR